MAVRHREDEWARRLEAARERDGKAAARDEEAAQRDREARKAARAAVESGPEDVERLLYETIAGSAADRAEAAADRKAAASDRDEAVREHSGLLREIEGLQLDDLTGALGRIPGEQAILEEIERARRSGALLTLAFIDVDGLKATNDRQGHAAGDALLVDVVAALRSVLGSTDPVTRWGGDEFVCAMANADEETATRRLDQARSRIETTHRGAGITFGLATTSDAASFDELLRRADRALLDDRAAQRREDAA